MSKNIKTLDKRQKKAILARLQQLSDPNTEIKIVDILDSTDEALLVRYDFDDELATCVYHPAAAALFTLFDWQGGYPSAIDEVEEYDWLTPNGDQAIVFNKLPRTFLI